MDKSYQSIYNFYLFSVTKALNSGGRDYYRTFLGVFKVLQCTLLGAALDNCLCFSFSKSILPTDSITIVNVRL